MKNISILIVDDHPIVRQGLRNLLSHEFRAAFHEAATVSQAIKCLTKTRCDLIVLDISIPGSDGFDLLRQVRVLRPDARVLMLSVHDDYQYAARALELGAHGYITKNADRSELLRAVTAVLAGNSYVCHSVAFRLAAAPESEEPPHSHLSPREMHVLLALAAGQRPIDIAAELHINPKTISTFRRRILKKLGLFSNADLVRYVLERHLNQPLPPDSDTEPVCTPPAAFV